uniref:Uncharacterized protein n=1 Tax=Panstrongylus lignarius TaxID=156445 RepID=A0A224Y2N6_9HEMI
MVDISLIPVMFFSGSFVIPVISGPSLDVLGFFCTCFSFLCCWCTSPENNLLLILSFALTSIVEDLLASPLVSRSIILFSFTVRFGL